MDMRMYRRRHLHETKRSKRCCGVVQPCVELSQLQGSRLDSHLYSTVYTKPGSQGDKII
jgi:hypothetical protein